MAVYTKINKKEIIYINKKFEVDKIISKKFGTKMDGKIGKKSVEKLVKKSVQTLLKIGWKKLVENWWKNW